MHTIQHTHKQRHTRWLFLQVGTLSSVFKAFVWESHTASNSCCLVCVCASASLLTCKHFKKAQFARRWLHRSYRKPAAAASGIRCRRPRPPNAEHCPPRPPSPTAGCCSACGTPGWGAGRRPLNASHQFTHLKDRRRGRGRPIHMCMCCVCVTVTLASFPVRMAHVFLNSLLCGPQAGIYGKPSVLRWVAGGRGQPPPRGQNAWWSGPHPRWAGQDPHPPPSLAGSKYREKNLQMQLGEKHKKKHFFLM